ncbi:hypothetical protein [Aureimonas sp. AU12]|uniref:hypothetical protein n=1 Tax=Aureimonas sp. AU12 TaxID=1638161 RepID=UPI0007862824|nr:hypothetical protein [Aureimonas sp. AU12]
MSFTPNEENSGDRLNRYNGGSYDPTTNPLGFDDGGNQAGVFTAMLKDVVTFGRGVVRVTLEALAAMNTTAARFEAAVAAIKAGPVSSVNGQIGAVTIDLSTISAEVEEQLAEVKAAQADLVAAQAGLLDDGIAYTLAFGN